MLSTASVSPDGSGNPGGYPPDRVLVLNRNWQPVNVVGVRRAFSLLWQDHARVIDTREGAFSPLDAEDWLELSLNAEVGPGWNYITTVRYRILIPKVLLLNSYDRLPLTEVKFNRENIFVRDQYTCQYTGRRCRPSELTLDHVIPQDRGGRTSWENIVTCAREINALKANRLPHEAGLKLLRRPRKPKLRPFAAMVASSRIEKDWLHFLPSESAVS